MMYLIYFVFIVPGVCFLVALINLITLQWLKIGLPESYPLVSVLIPARNEENNIGNLLDSLLEQDYQNIEIIVYDDVSEDLTISVVKRYMEVDSRINLIEGDYLPRGWLGKNYACHNLAKAARGSYLLYLDADVTIKPGFINSSLAYVQKYNLSLLIVFPKQIMKIPGEKITVSIMNWIWLSLLPFTLNRTSKRPSFSAATGRCMLFDTAVYRKHRFHSLIKLNPVDNVAILRLMKKKQYRTHTLVSGRQISCTMYTGFKEAVNGFSKIMVAFWGIRVKNELYPRLLKKTND